MSPPPTTYPGFSTPAIDRIWAAGSRVGAMLEFEAALALALADTGLAPKEEAEAAAEACLSWAGDPDAILTSTWEEGTPLIALVDEVRGRLTDDRQRRWVHHGATTQDAVDTAHMLLARTSLAVIEENLTHISRSLLAIIETHGHQPHMARTFLQAARPITFGRRATSWLEPTLRHLEGVRQTRQELAVQLGGPVGVRDAYGPAGPEVMTALAERLGLVTTAVSWHAERSRIWSLVEAVAAPVRTLAKTALDLALLAQGHPPEITMRSGGSSSMPAKRNPIDAIRALAAAEAFGGAATMITAAKPHELDRGLGSWHVEWYALPLIFGTAAAVMEAAQRALDSLAVDTEAMAAMVPPDEVPDDQAGDIDGVIALFDQIVGRA